ncbi:MAG: rRNA pseudouridine synthase [Bacilli bacterium]|nr:rRNA pseudouridine synthase [Bacilli bacterium]
MERLQKRIAASGIASRRKAEELIKLGQVKVNDQVVTEMGFLVSDKDQIKVNNKLITKVEEKIYLALNKPQSVICSVKDEHKRKTVIDILPEIYKEFRLFPVGRLDYDTKGILLLTNDGEFMNHMVGPRSGIEKEYLARVEGVVEFKELNPLIHGLEYKGTSYLPAYVEIVSVDREHNSSLIKIIITEGKYHQVKNMFLAINHPVKKLTRTRFGVVTTKDLLSGEVRNLTVHEVKQLIALSKQEKNIRKRS